MRQRITFVHDPDDSFDPDQLQLSNSTLHVSRLKAAREDRFTFGFQELPQEIWRVLKQCHELHIRWSSPTPYPLVSPFNARVSPGLHLFYTPQRHRPADLLCPLLKKVFGDGLKCVSTEESFTHLSVTSERFTASAAFQYYQLIPSLDNLIAYVEQKICPDRGDVCYAYAKGLASADSLDIDFDTISQSLTISGFRHAANSSLGWDEQITNFDGSARVEVGVLANEKPTEPEELSLGGFLNILGEDDKPSPTLFSFPARHHMTPDPFTSTFLTTFLSPVGLHPTLRLTLPSTNLEAPSDNCALHSYLTLPSTLFPDKYQLSSSLFLASKNLRSLRSVSGETDLEAPDWAIMKWGSSMLIELAVPLPRSNFASEYWHADIPLHLRYLSPSESGLAYIEIPWPVVFWACTAEEGSKMKVNPFDRINLGYDGLFGPKTMFYHLEPGINRSNTSGKLIERLSVPVLQSHRIPWIEPGTVAVVVLGFCWILWKLLRVTIGVGNISKSKMS